MAMKAPRLAAYLLLLAVAGCGCEDGAYERRAGETTPFMACH
jgi:hypothetical protein